MILISVTIGFEKASFVEGVIYACRQMKINNTQRRKIVDVPKIILYLNKIVV